MKMFKTVLQVVSIFTPIFYWNFNADNMTTTDGLLLVFIGGLVAALVEYLFRMYKLMNS